MPLRLKIKKELTARSDRVKSVDIFPGDNPWVLVALYSGNIYIWDYSSNNMIKSFETGNNPVRCAKFIVRKQYIIAGTDDMKLRVFNYNTMDKVKEWEAHTDYIRYLEVHPNRPLVLSCSDDMSVKMWDYDKDFDCVCVYEGHSHYVMMVRINPRDSNTFCSASLDKTIKVWGLTASTAHFTLEGHEKGVNCVDYYPGGDKPYLLSGADDRTLRIWDYQTKACLQVLEGHSHNVSAVCFHPRLPILLSASEDGTVRLWHSTTYRPETTLNYGLERAWCLAPSAVSNKVAIGYDEGTIVIKLGNERPVASLDTHTGKLVYAKSHDIVTCSLRGLAGEGVEGGVADGEKLPLAPRELGSCEVYPQNLSHNSNGMFVCVCGDGEYIIYTSQALRNKAFGSALDFVWGEGSGDYAIRESISRVRIFRNFKEHRSPTLPLSSAEGIFGGKLLGVRGGDAVCFFTWSGDGGGPGGLVRKIDVSPRAVYWSEAGDRVVLATEEMFYVLGYRQDLVDNSVGGAGVSDEGVEGAFELLYTISESITSGQWVGECFLFTTQNNKVAYMVGGGVLPLVSYASHPSPLYLLGYVAKEDRVFLMDTKYDVLSVHLMVSVLTYQTAVMRGEVDVANQLLPKIPKSQWNQIAKFLESQNYKEEALSITQDPEHKFELAIELRKLEQAKQVLMGEGGLDSLEGEAGDDGGSTDLQSKWRRLGDLALHFGDVSLSEMAARRAGDLSGLLLLHTSRGDREGLVRVGEEASKGGRFNVAFVAFFLSGLVEKALDVLIKAKRLPEAGFFARTYLPSHMSQVLALWKADMEKGGNKRGADALADPSLYPNLFPDLSWALKAEQLFLQARGQHVPAESYPQAKGELDLDLIALLKERGLGNDTSEGNGDEEGEEEEKGEEEPEAEAEADAEEEEQVEEEPAPAAVAASSPSSPAKSPAPSAPSSPVKSPAPASAPATPAPVVTPRAPSPPVEAEEQGAEEEEDLDLDDLGGDEGEGDNNAGDADVDLLEKDEGETFDEGEDW